MRLTLLASFLVAISVAEGALADVAADPIGAEALFKAGQASFDKGDFAAACPRFEASLKLDRAAGTLLNLGACDEKLGRVGSAWEAYTEALERLPADDRRVAYAKAQAAALEPRVPRLTIRASADARAGTVDRDGVVLASAALDVPLPTDPGHHVITVAAPGRASRTFAIDLAERDRAELAVDVGPAASSAVRSAGFVLAGVGLLGLAAGAISGLVALDDKSQVKNNCSADLACNSTGLAAASAGKTASTVSTVGFIAGGALAATGVVLVVVGARGSSSPSRATAWIAPSISPSAGSLTFGGSF